MADGYVASSTGNLLVPGHAATPAAEPVIYMPSGEAVALDCPPLPPGLGHLDEHAGRAVPWIAWRRPGGGIDITEYDGTRFIECITERTCAMCALPLVYWLGFMVTAETDAHARAVRKMTEPPMHRPCAQYAAAAWWRDRTHLYVTRSFDRRDQDDDPVHPVICYAAPAKRVERFR